MKMLALLILCACGGSPAELSQHSRALTQTALGGGPCNQPFTAVGGVGYYCYSIGINDGTLDTLAFTVTVQPDGTFSGGRVWRTGYATGVPLWTATDWAGAGFAGDFTGGSLSVTLQSDRHLAGRRWVTSWRVMPGGELVEP